MVLSFCLSAREKNAKLSDSTEVEDEAAGLIRIEWIKDPMRITQQYDFILGDRQPLSVRAGEASQVKWTRVPLNIEENELNAQCPVIEASSLYSKRIRLTTQQYNIKVLFIPFIIRVTVINTHLSL